MMPRIESVFARRIEFVNLGLKTSIHLRVSHKREEQACEHERRCIRAGDYGKQGVCDDIRARTAFLLRAIFIALPRAVSAGTPKIAGRRTR